MPRDSSSENTIAIIGAGSVGATIAYAAMLRGLTPQIILNDVNKAKCAAEVKDLNHGLRFVPAVRVRAGSIEDCREAAVVIVTAGAKQKPGQSRLDLAASNVQMFRELIPSIAAVAPEAVLLIVSNPVDVLTYAAVKLHPGPPGRVLGSGTVLDSSRFVTLIAERVNVSVHNVHAYIAGEHGESELPLWSSAHVGNMPLHEFHPAGHLMLTVRDRAEIIANVRDAAAQIIEAKGATNWAIGLAVVRIVDAILRNENGVLTVSRLLENYRGISDVCLSVPCLVNRNGVGEPLPVEMSEDEVKGLQASAEVLKTACRQVALR